MIHKPKLLSIKISHEKGTDRMNINSGFLYIGCGLEGDAYSKPGDREVCIMSKSTIDKLNSYGDGLCVKRFIETLCIDIDSELIEVGDILELGESRVEITIKGKRCFPECKLIKDNKRCPLVSEPMFGKVIQSGRIEVK